MKYTIFIILFFIYGCYGKKPMITGLEGQKLPSYNVLLADSSSFNSSILLKDNQPVVVFYFSPYCPYCKVQTQKIVENQNDLKDIKFFFISHFSTSHVKAFYDTFNLKKYPNIVTGIDNHLEFANYYMLKSVPLIAIYGRNKQLINVFKGLTEIDQIKTTALQ